MRQLLLDPRRAGASVNTTGGGTRDLFSKNAHSAATGWALMISKAVRNQSMKRRDSRKCPPTEHHRTAYDEWLLEQAACPDLLGKIAQYLLREAHGRGMDPGTAWRKLALAVYEPTLITPPWEFFNDAWTAAQADGWPSPEVVARLERHNEAVWTRTRGLIRDPSKPPKPRACRSRAHKTERSRIPSA
jgi:hypothetical protein